MNTNHSFVRAKERAGWNEQQTVRYTGLAIERGSVAEELPKKEREYLSLKDVNGCKSVYYNNYIYIFTRNGTLVTIYEAPHWFGKKAIYSGKERIRDVKKYARYSAACGVA